jgi:hypothetical protein
MDMHITNFSKWHYSLCSDLDFLEDSLKYSEMSEMVISFMMGHMSLSLESYLFLMFIVYQNTRVL